jgi:hypothetical protein
MGDEARTVERTRRVDTRGAVRLLGRAVGLARRRIPELAILLVAILVRVSMARTFSPQAGYDFVDHWGYVQWIAKHHSLPPIGLNYDSYSAPLYYLLAATLKIAGWGPPGIRGLSFLFAGLRLALLWGALELFLPARRLARLTALALAAVLPTAVHVDGMLSNEPLSCLLCMAAIFGMPRLLRVGGARRLSVAVGALCGLALLAKVSGVMLLASLALTFAILVLQERTDRWELLRRSGPAVAVVFVVAFAISGWFYVRNHILYGKFVPTSYDSIAKAEQEPFEKIPYLDRRTAGFFVGLSGDIVQDPYYPTVAGIPSARFWPALTVTSFADYYVYGFAPLAAAGDPGVDRRGRLLSTAAFQLSRVSVAGGVLIALLTAVTLLCCLRRLWRDGDERMVLLLFPLLAIAGQLHFAVQYPNDGMGPIKGAYLQFAAGPLFAMFGLGVDWLWRRSRSTRLLAMLGGGGALAATAAYTLYCRFAPFLR